MCKTEIASDNQCTTFGRNPLVPKTAEGTVCRKIIDRTLTTIIFHKFYRKILKTKENFKCYYHTNKLSFIKLLHSAKLKFMSFLSTNWI